MYYDAMISPLWQTRNVLKKSLLFADTHYR